MHTRNPYVKSIRNHKMHMRHLVFAFLHVPANFKLDNIIPCDNRSPVEQVFVK